MNGYMPVSADQFIEVLSCATEENQVSSLRQHQVIVLPDAGEVYVTGDMHDHQRNFDRLVRAVDLPNHPERHIILHELIHGERFDANGADGSWETLYRAAELKCDYPLQVHFLLANHDLAQVYGEGIMKGGMSVCEAFTAGLRRDFPDRSGSVTASIADFLMSLPLAVRTPNGFFICHSIPRDDQFAAFDFGVFDRPLTGADYKRRVGSVYQMVWGRNVTPQGAGEFADRVKARILITGHQPQETGFHVNGERHLIIASDHNQGVYVQLDLAREYQMPEVVSAVRKLIEVDLASEDEDDHPSRLTLEG
jgi:hypothetical protein